LRKTAQWPTCRRSCARAFLFCFSWRADDARACAHAHTQIELKKKYKFRLILDESISFGTVGRTGRGLTELYNVPASEIDILVGSVANGLNSAGGFCAGTRPVTEHQVRALLPVPFPRV
jgi:serine palmitoyltransferase